MATVKSNLFGYFSDESIYSTNFHFYHTLDDEIMKKIILSYMENGLLDSIVRKRKRMSFSSYIRENKYFSSTKEYIDEFASFDNLSFENFDGIFKIYFLFCLIVLLIFGIHLLITFLFDKKEKKEASQKKNRKLKKDSERQKKDSERRKKKLFPSYMYQPKSDYYFKRHRSFRRPNLYYNIKF